MQNVPKASLADLASVGTIVTVAAHLDPNYDYYLLQVTTNEAILLQEEYITLEGCENADGTPRKNLNIVSKETSPSELVNYLKQLLQSYPYHQFMSCWQKSQFDSLKENLPIDNVLCVHDYSENYECSYQEEVQSQYFSKTEASIHVTILYRHAS